MMSVAKVERIDADSVTAGRVERYMNVDVHASAPNAAGPPSNPCSGRRPLPVPLGADRAGRVALGVGAGDEALEGASSEQ
jgi:hypothetical protein